MDVSITAARDSLVTTKTDRRVAIWVSDGSGANAKEVVPATQSSGTGDDVTWAADRLLFTSTIGGHRSISSVGQDGGTSQEVVTQGVCSDHDLRRQDGCIQIDRSCSARGSGRSPTGVAPRSCWAGQQAGPA